MKIDDVIYVVEQLGGDGIYKMSNKHAMFACVNAPWGHTSGQDSGRKMGVLIQPGKALVNCFRPGCVHGTLLQVVGEVGGRRVADGLMTMDELSNLKAFVMLAEEDDDDLSAAARGAETPATPALPDSVAQVLGRGSPYWRSRGASADTEQRWQLGETGGRAYIPLFAPDGRVVGAQGRLISGHPKDTDGFEEKYRTRPKGLQKELLLAQPPEHVPAEGVPYIILVESPADAMLLDQWGREHGLAWRPVAALGGQVSEAQKGLILEQLAKDGELVLGMDTDEAGRLAQRRLGEQLWARVSKLSVVTWPEKDPSSGDPAAAIQAFEQRESYVEARLRRILTKTSQTINLSS